MVTPFWFLKRDDAFIDPKKYVSPVCVWRIINDYKTSPDDDGIPSSLNFEKHTHTQQQTQRNTTHF